MRLLEFDHGGEPPTFVACVVDDLEILFQVDTPRPAELESYLDAFRPELGVLTGALVYVPPGGKGPDSAQRKRLTEFWKSVPEHLPHAVMSDSVVIRGLVTALAWFSPENQFRMYGLQDFDASLAFLDTRPDAAVVCETIRRLAEELGYAGPLPLGGPHAEPVVT